LVYYLHLQLPLEICFSFLRCVQLGVQPPLQLLLPLLLCEQLQLQWIRFPGTDPSCGRWQTCP